MSDKFDFMGQVKHISGYMFVILYDLDDKYLIAHPKYDLRNGVCRISNPVDPNRNNQLDVEKTVKFGKKDYLILKDDIVEYYPCFGIDNSLLIGTAKSENTYAALRELIELFSKIIPKENIGVTGSLAIGNASDGYSDIDILLKEKDFRELASSNIFTNANIQIRNKTQWVEFYNHYGVFCALNAEEFADAALNKFQQFIYKGIPISIFIDAGRDFLQITNSFSTTDTGLNAMVVLKGRVISENLIKLPGYIFVECNNRISVIINLHRTYQNCLYLGDYCEIKARTSSFTDLYIVNYDNICYIKRRSGDQL